MKVKELIKYLQELDSEAVIALAEDEEENLTPYRGNIRIKVVDVVEHGFWKDIYSYPEKADKDNKNKKQQIYVICDGGLIPHK